jgi:hypothetical protein
MRWTRRSSFDSSLIIGACIGFFNQEHDIDRAPRDDARGSTQKDEQ